MQSVVPGEILLFGSNKNSGKKTKFVKKVQNMLNPNEIVHTFERLHLTFDEVRLPIIFNGVDHVRNIVSENFLDFVCQY